MAGEYNIAVTQNIETQEFEIIRTHKLQPDRPSVMYIQTPCDLEMRVEDGGGRLYIGESGQDGGYGFMDLDLDQAIDAFNALCWVVAAQQVVNEEESGTMIAYRRLGGRVAGL